MHWLLFLALVTSTADLPPVSGPAILVSLQPPDSGDTWGLSFPGLPAVDRRGQVWVPYEDIEERHFCQDLALWAYGRKGNVVKQHPIIDEEECFDPAPAAVVKVLSRKDAANSLLAKVAPLPLLPIPLDCGDGCWTAATVRGQAHGVTVSLIDGRLQVSVAEKVVMKRALKAVPNREARDSPDEAESCGAHVPTVLAAWALPERRVALIHSWYRSEKATDLCLQPVPRYIVATW